VPNTLLQIERRADVLVLVCRDGLADNILVLSTEAVRILGSLILLGTTMLHMTTRTKDPMPHNLEILCAIVQFGDIGSVHSRWSEDMFAAGTRL
jgi:hypothetical protein